MKGKAVSMALPLGLCDVRWREPLACLGFLKATQSHRSLWAWSLVFFYETEKHGGNLLTQDL